MKNQNWPKLAEMVEQGNIHISPVFEDGGLDTLNIKSCFSEKDPALDLEREAGGVAYPVVLEGLTRPVFNWIICEKEEQQMFLRGILPFLKTMRPWAEEALKILETGPDLEQLRTFFHEQEKVGRASLLPFAMVMRFGN